MTLNKRHCLKWFCLIASAAIATLWPSTVALGQTPVKSSAERRLKRIEEHRQVRQSILELQQDLRAVDLTAEQKEQIQQVMTRYHRSTGTDRAEANQVLPNASSGEAAEAGPSASPRAAERMKAEISALLTPEQNETLNSMKHEREEHAQKSRKFQIRKKP